jgi:hypothetical protein
MATPVYYATHCIGLGNTWNISRFFSPYGIYILPGKIIRLLLNI